MADRSVATTDTVETFRTTFNNLASDLGDISNLDVPGGATDLVEAVNTAANASASFVIGDDSSTEATISTGHTMRLKSGSGISATVSPTDDSISIAISLGSIAAAGSDTDKFLVADSGVIKTRTGAQVLSDIGGLSSVSFNNRKYTGDGSTTAFTLSNSASVNDVFVFYNGVAMKPTTDYGISGATLTFTFTPVNNSNIMARYFV